MRLFKYALGLVFVSCMMLSSGCGGGVKSADDIRNSWNNSNMERIISLYIQHQRSHVYRGPASEDKFKDYIRSLNEESLVNFGIEPDKIDDLFISERDSEPFEIRYKLKSGDRDPRIPIVFEKTGVNGVRKVGFNARKIIDVDNDQDYQDLLAGKQIADVSSR